VPPVDLKSDLFSIPPGVFASRWIFERTPHVFAADHESYISWKHDLGDAIEVDPRAIILVGSAAVGSSLSPYKNLKPFDDDSDIDVAVVSAHHFNILWHWLRNLGSERYKFPADAQRWIDEHRKRLVYWGVIATDRLLPLTPLASRWVPALEKMSKRSPAEGREINIRLYMDFDALRAYQALGIRELREKLTSST
jgi:predicted nucleotidyltransferase